MSMGSNALERVRRQAQKNGYHRQVPNELGHQLSSGPFGATGKGKKANREPQLVGDVLNSFYVSRSAYKKLVLPQIVEAWDQIVGELVAQHTTPKALSDEVLFVAADSTVWASQLTALAPILVAKINDATNTKTVNRIEVKGPKANVPNYGPRTVKGRLGYRDTFG